ncbi:MAG: EamA family transporter [Rhodospirillaceae bacterium]|nr:EamA family transporter [Rhodospirillaceae bacterium]
MELWIPLTIAAAGVQAARTSLQKHLAAELSVFGATFARFLFGFPMILAGLAVLVTVTGQSVPESNCVFIAYAWVGGLVQLLGNALLLHLLTLSTFTVGTTYTKTEVIQTVGVGYVVLDEQVGPAGFLGILVAFFGVLLMATGRAGLSVASLAAALRHKPALYGICVGALYAVAAVFYRAAALSLDEGDFVLRAITTLAWVTTAQMLAMAVVLRLRQPGLVTKVFRAWPIGLWIGFTGIVASACWYCAFTLQNAAYVMALGQVELVFIYIASRFVFHERMVAQEAFGVAATALGILAVVLYG